MLSLFMSQSEKNSQYRYVLLWVDSVYLLVTVACQIHSGSRFPILIYWRRNISILNPYAKLKLTYYVPDVVWLLCVFQYYIIFVCFNYFSFCWQISIAVCLSLWNHCQHAEHSSSDSERHVERANQQDFDGPGGGRHGSNVGIRAVRRLHDLWRAQKKFLLSRNHFSFLPCALLPGHAHHLHLSHSDPGSLEMYCHQVSSLLFKIRHLLSIQNK